LSLLFQRMLMNAQGWLSDGIPYTGQGHAVPLQDERMAPHLRGLTLWCAAGVWQWLRREAAPRHR
jgi:hypothetical protein